MSSWLREIFPHFQIREHHARTTAAAFESRYMDWHLPITLQDSTFIEIGVNTERSKC